MLLCSCPTLQLLQWKAGLSLWVFEQHSPPHLGIKDNYSLPMGKKGTEDREKWCRDMILVLNYLPTFGKGGSTVVA